MDKSPALNAARAESEDLRCQAATCYICLNPFDKQVVGSLENCQHVFCLECILQWSQTANTCPVDRISFAFIHQRPNPGGNVQKKIKVRIRKMDDGDDEEEGNGTAVLCEECGRGDRRHRLLVCVLCDSGYHMHCLRPSVNMEPEDDWICSECAVAPHHTESSRAEEEISDGELTDLLAEVEETASISGRLRPSTTSRPSSSAERRRSTRIQSRASGNPVPRPQASWHVPKYLLRASKPAVPTDDAHNRSESSRTPGITSGRWTSVSRGVGESDTCTSIARISSDRPSSASLSSTKPSPQNTNLCVSSGSFTHTHIHSLDIKSIL